MAKKVEIEQTEIETPYELPEGWKWCRLGDVFEINPKVKADDVLQASFIPMEKIEPNNKNQFSFSVDLWGKIKKNHTQFQNGDVCFAKISPCFENGKAFIADGLENGIGSGTTELIVLRNHDIDSKYTFYFISDLSFIRKGCATYSGTVGQQRISMDFVQSYPFPIPPTLTEQKRIVSRIEMLFAKLDEAEEKARAVQDSFETRKAAILHKAFSGELTASWRKENGVADDSWEEKTVGECCSEVKVGIVIKPTRYYTEEEMGIPAFRSANVRENHIDDFDWVYINAEGMKNEKRSIVHTNDVLVVRSGAPGTACVVTEQFDGYNAIDILIAVPLQVVINSYFLCYYTNSPMGKNIVAEKKRGLGLTHFNVKGYSATPIRIPSLIEQKEIVRVLDTVLEKESRAKEAAQTVLDQIAMLKKSILARAFRGEL